MQRIIGLALLSVLCFITPGWSQPTQKRPRPNLLQNLIPPGTVVEKDLAYVKNGHNRQKLDLYVHEKGGDKRPLLVWVHGGGWQKGSKDQPVALAALRGGLVVASLNYRLSQDAHFPAQIQDCQAAIRWLKGHADQYKINPDQVAVWGASAGGHLVSLLGTASDSTAWEPVGEFRNLSPRVQCVINWFGPADFIPFTSLVERGGENMVSKLIGPTDGNLTAKLQAASPVTYVTKDDAPFLIFHGDADPLVPLQQSETLRDTLKKAGVPVELVVLKGAGHGGPDFVAEKQRQTIREFLAKELAVK